MQIVLGCSKVVPSPANMANKNSPETLARFKAEGICPQCRTNPVYSNRARCLGCLRKQSGRSKRLRVRAIEFLGARCVCCGEENLGFLTLDHINNDGYKDRSPIQRGRNISTLARAILARKRTDIQVLCFNCNCGRASNNGVCPHMAQYQPSPENDREMLKTNNQHHL